MADKPDLPETLGMLEKLHRAKDWTTLRDRAITAAGDFPDSAFAPAYVAHAMRQLGQLEEGYAWAVRAVAIEPDNLFAINRVSLLANLTGRFAEAYACVQPVLDDEPETAAGTVALQQALPNVHVGKQKSDRYVSVGE